MEAKESLFECLEQVPGPQEGQRGQTSLSSHSASDPAGPGLRSDHHGPHRPLRQDELAGSEGALGVPPGSSSPRHHHLAHLGGGLA